MGFRKAQKEQTFLRLALQGPSGSGKTKTALKVSAGLGDRIAFLDSERRSGLLYVGEPDVPAFDYDELTDFSPLAYVKKIHEAEKAGYDVLIIDSLSHAWEGEGGALEIVDQKKRQPGKNGFNAWADVTPMQHALVQAILGSKMHIIVTMRVKTDWVMEDNGRGKQTPRKVGLAPVQRAGIEYEFTVVMDLDTDHIGTISKTRASILDGKTFHKPGREVSDMLMDWLRTGAVEAPRSLESAPVSPQPYTGANEANVGPSGAKPVELPADILQHLLTMAFNEDALFDRYKHIEHPADRGYEMYRDIKRLLGVTNKAQLMAVTPDQLRLALANAPEMPNV